MKRFWLVLLSLGLVMAFSAQAFAVDVKFSGSYYAAGMYLDKTSLVQNQGATTYWAETDLVAPAVTYAMLRAGTIAAMVGAGYPLADATAYAYNVYKVNALRHQGDGASAAFYFQRLRLQTDFIVSEGLKLVTRADILERAWGAARSNPTQLDTAGFIIQANGSQGTTAENENIAFDWAYVSYLSPIGMFNVGIMDDGQWGTVFGDDDSTMGKVQFVTKLDSVIIAAYAGKYMELSNTAKYATSATDQDYDKYVLLGVYKSKNLDAGFLYQYRRIAIDRANPFKAGAFFFPKALGVAHGFNPYVKATMGPLKVEAEVTYAIGTITAETNGIGALSGYDEVRIDNKLAYLKAVLDFGPVYVGGTFAYVSGDDPGTLDKNEGGFIVGGTAWSPCLIMFSADRTQWAGGLPGYNSYNGYTAVTFVDNAMYNAWFFQANIGVRPTAALDLGVSVSYANADKKPLATWLYNDYGYEVDATATYKITNNLSYMLGAGYLFTGKFFKGTSDSNEVINDYLVINKLTLTF
jgi:hypothetical protein